MSDLPSGWAEATIGDTGGYLNGLAFRPTDWGDSGRPIIRIQNLTDPTKPLNRTLRAVPDRYIVRSGDLLVSWPASLDAHVWDREDAILNQHIFKAEPVDGLTDQRFLYYALRRAIAEIVEGEHLHGSTMKHINRGPFLAHRLCLPPLAEQRRIVAKIDALTARSKCARSELEQVRAIRTRLLAAILDGPASERWPSSSISQVADVITGSTPPTGRDDCHGGDVPFVKPTDLEAGYSVANARQTLSAK